MDITLLLSSKVLDAREAMKALISSRSLSLREDEPGYPMALAKLAWKIADAMTKERLRRARKAAK
ncbi:MAG TPA: hypothetical protein VK550_00905 [Polyangiaceae bacterium]|jgi:hypothetical protein|nr:hypothetical protein [Polyangiaceae bacterium]